MSSTRTTVDPCRAVEGAASRAKLARTANVINYFTNSVKHYQENLPQTV